MRIAICSRIVLVGALSLSLIACTSEYRKARSEFVAGCRDNGTSSEICNCAFEILEDHYDEDQIIQMSRGTPLPELAERLVQAAVTCQNPNATSLLNLGGEVPPSSDQVSTIDETASPASASGRTTATAVLKIGRDYVADAQGAFTAASVVDYCRSFSDVLVQPQDIQDCLRLVEVVPELRRDMPAPQDQAELFQAAAQLPLLRRFALCTSDQGLRFVTSLADYDGCMPPELDKSLNDALARALSEARERAGVGPPAFPYNDPLWSASQLGPEQRMAYCNIPDIGEQLEGDDKANCLKGIDPDAQSEDATSQPSTNVQANAFAILMNASRLRAQDERNAFCSQPDVLNVLSEQQRSACLVGLSPNRPPAKPLTDQDPGYRDEGH